MKRIANTDKLKPILLTPKVYTALISVHIPFSSLGDNRIDYKSVAKSIAIKTNTHIECYELSHLSKIRFCIFGKWRNCLQAGRLLWYQLLRQTMIYVHSDWTQELDKPLIDQKGKTFRHLYRSVKYKTLNEYNIVSISGPCWDVLKVRKELIKRKSLQANDMQSINTKREITALQILKCIRADIHDDIHTPDSIYSIRNSQLIELLTGFKTITSIDQIKCPKVGKLLITDRKTENQSNDQCLEESKSFMNNRKLSKQEKTECLASILRELSLESNDDQIITQVQQLLKSSSSEVHEKVHVNKVMMKFKPKRYSLLRSSFKFNSNQLKSDEYYGGVENRSMDSIERISLENESQIDCYAEKLERNMSLICKNNSSMIGKSHKEEAESDLQIDESREHLLIVERIKQLIDYQKSNLCDEILSNDNNNNYCEQQLIDAKVTNIKPPAKEIDYKRLFRRDLTKNLSIYNTQNSHLKEGLNRKERQETNGNCNKNSNECNSGEISSSNFTLLSTNSSSVTSLRKPFMNS